MDQESSGKVERSRNLLLKKKWARSNVRINGPPQSLNLLLLSLKVGGWSAGDQVSTGLWTLPNVSGGKIDLSKSLSSICFMA